MKCKIFPCIPGTPAFGLQNNLCEFATLTSTNSKKKIIKNQFKTVGSKISNIYKNI